MLWLVSNKSLKNFSVFLITFNVEGRQTERWSISASLRNTPFIIDDLLLEMLFTTKVENLHAALHFKDETFTVLKYA